MKVAAMIYVGELSRAEEIRLADAFSTLAAEILKGERKSKLFIEIQVPEEGA